MADDRAGQPAVDAEWEALARYLAGECTPEESRRVRERLDADPGATAMVESLDAALRLPPQEPLSHAEVESALTAVLARRDAPPATPSVERRHAPAAERPSVRLARMRWQWRHAGLRAAAAVLVVAGASLLWRSTRPSTDASGSAASPAAADVGRFVTQVGQMDSVRLSDGTRVILGPVSSLLLTDGYGASGREVTLTGEAYFDVVHDERVPFVVRTGNATMRDVGTRFTVRSDGKGGTRVAVTEGAVDVAAREGGAPAVLLRAGDRAVVADGGSMRVERGVASEDEMSWTRGVLRFHDAPLADVAVGLRRWFGLELVVTDSALAGRRLTASFEQGSADDVGAVLAAALGGSASRSRDTLRISPVVSAR